MSGKNNFNNTEQMAEEGQEALLPRNAQKLRSYFRKHFFEA